MISVPEAAARVGKSPETVRRWIRSGRLRSQRVGTQHLINEADLREVSRSNHGGVHAGWTAPGQQMPDWVALVREIRDSR